MIGTRTGIQSCNSSTLYQAQIAAQAYNDCMHSRKNYICRSAQSHCRTRREYASICRWTDNAILLCINRFLVHGRKLNVEACSCSPATMQDTVTQQTSNNWPHAHLPHKHLLEILILILELIIKLQQVHPMLQLLKTARSLLFALQYIHKIAVLLHMSVILRSIPCRGNRAEPGQRQQQNS